MSNYCNYYFYKRELGPRGVCLIGVTEITGPTRVCFRQMSPLDTISYIEVTRRVGRCLSKCTVGCFGRLILTWVTLLNVVIANESNDNVPVTRSALKGHRQNFSHTFLFSYDLEMKTSEQNRNNKRTEIERFDWSVDRIQTCVAFGWLSERSGEKTSCPRTV